MPRTLLEHKYPSSPILFLLFSLSLTHSISAISAIFIPSFERVCLLFLPFVPALYIYHLCYLTFLPAPAPAPHISYLNCLTPLHLPCPLPFICHLSAIYVNELTLTWCCGLNPLKDDQRTLSFHPFPSVVKNPE